VAAGQFDDHHARTPGFEIEAAEHPGLMTVDVDHQQIEAALHRRRAGPIHGFLPAAARR
jgi:hypothetical protein